MRKSNQVGAHFDKIANSYDLYKKNNQYYYDNLKILLASFIHSKSKVLEIGCGTGDLIASLKPEYGMGFDISNKMIAIAKRKHRNIHFSTHWPKQKFDYIFMSDVVEHLEYPDETFRKISKLMNCKSIFICTMANPKLEPILMIAEKMKLKMPEEKEEVETLKYHCGECGTDFEVKGNKKGNRSRDVLHCGKKSFFSGHNDVVPVVMPRPVHERAGRHREQHHRHDHA